MHQYHEEQKGNQSETFEWRKKWLTESRSQLGMDVLLLNGIATRPKATPELIKAGIKVALEHEARIDGIVLKHYDGTLFSGLRAIRQGLIDMGVQGLTPLIGKEVEEMDLENFEVAIQVDESCVMTSSKGTASCVFDHASGTYTVKISYFDEEKGQSGVKLLVNGEEKAGFQMDKDTDCGRCCILGDVRLKRGDIIQLVGKADKKKRCILDFIEFIP